VYWKVLVLWKKEELIRKINLLVRWSNEQKYRYGLGTYGIGTRRKVKQQRGNQPTTRLWSNEPISLQKPVSERITVPAYQLIRLVAATTTTSGGIHADRHLPLYDVIIRFGSTVIRDEGTDGRNRTRNEPPSIERRMQAMERRAPRVGFSGPQVLQRAYAQVL